MYLNFKSIADILFSFIAIVCFLWVMLLVFIIQLLFYKGNPFFFQKRIGLDEKKFVLFKFRTMQNEKILGKFAIFLRKSNLDELPQLFNILIGQMSFVGPRPLLPEYLQKYTSEQRKRHLVKPGLTGLVQVSGANALDWQKRFDLDLQYVESQSFFLDLQILWRTFIKLFSPNKEPILSKKFEGND